MEHYAGIDVSLEYSSVCVVDGSGKILREARVASEPEALIGWFRSSGFGGGFNRSLQHILRTSQLASDRARSFSAFH